MLTTYLAVGVYLAASITHLDSFKDATTVSIAKGVALGLLLWPVGLVILYMETKKNA